MENGKLTESKVDHIRKLFEKSNRSRRNWDKFMMLNGLFSDFESEKSVSVKSNSDSSQPTKQAPDKDTTAIHVKFKQFFERVEHEI